MARSLAKTNCFVCFVYLCICCLHRHLNELVYFLCFVVVVFVVLLLVVVGGVVFKPPMIPGPCEGP